MFLQLREAASAIPTIWLNLALVSADMGQYRNAVLSVSLDLVFCDFGLLMRGLSSFQLFFCLVLIQ